ASLCSSSPPLPLPSSHVFSSPPLFHFLFNSFLSLLLLYPLLLSCPPHTSSLSSLSSSPLSLLLSSLSLLLSPLLLSPLSPCCGFAYCLFVCVCVCVVRSPRV